MSHEPKASKGIDPVMLAAYIEKKLPPEQRAAVEAQLATDPDSYAVLVEAMRALDAIGDESDVPKVPGVPDVPRAPVVPMVPKATASTTRLLVTGGVVAMAAAIVLVLMQPAFLQRYLGTDVDSRFERLVAAVGEERYVEPRLSGNFAYGGRRSELRGESRSAQSNVSLLTAAEAAEQAAAASPTSGNLHVWGVAQLLLGRHDDAIDTLLKAIAAPAPDARMQSDLAAAYLDRAARTNDNADRVAALEHADAALAVERSSLPAAFNRALALEGLGRSSEALSAWQYFVSLDPQTGWADEARVHIRNLEGTSRPVARVMR
jgi:tetratricopeptide (TPR) repeat protein